MSLPAQCMNTLGKCCDNLPESALKDVGQVARPGTSASQRDAMTWA